MDSQQVLIANTVQHRVKPIYKFISFQDRLKLIQQVCVNHKQIKTTAAQMDISLSTAKHILMNFRRFGHVASKFSGKKLQRQAIKQKIDKLTEKAGLRNRKTSKIKNKPSLSPQQLNNQNQIHFYGFNIYSNPLLNYIPAQMNPIHWQYPFMSPNFC